MNRLVPLASVFLALLSVPASPVALATTGIMKCANPDGSTVYTDRACRPGSTAVPISGQLLTRIARDEARSGNAIDASPPGAIPVGPRRSVADGCARTARQLQMDLRAAIALGDVNRIAESYHWVGLSTREGERVLDRLQRMARQPVADAHYFDAVIASPLDPEAVEIASADTGPGSAGMLQLQLGGGTGASVVDLDVERYAGCYFVKF
jgi:hypothetical protein